MHGKLRWSAEGVDVGYGADSFGATLRRLRQEKGLSQRSIVRRLHLSAHSSIADFESGRRVPHEDIVTNYERIFGVPTGMLQRLRAQALATRVFDRTLLASPPQTWPVAAPAEGVQPVYSQLPPDVPQFVARREEILQVIGLLTSLPKFVGIFGPPGIGKTALAVHIAHLAQIRFPDGRLCVDLRGDTGRPVATSTALARLLRWLQVSPVDIPRTFDDKLALYQTLTASRSLTVVLDNVHDEAQVRDLLPAAGDCLVMVTGRRTLYGLSLAVTLVLRELSRDQAIELLMSAANRTDLQVGSGPAAIVERCGGLPLALVIAGQRLSARPTWSAEQLAALLAEDGRVLDHLVSGELGVKAAFARSYVRLEEDLRRLFRRAALLGPRPFDRSLASLLVDGSAPTALERLVDENLLRADGDSHYRFDPLLYSFARERVLAEEGRPERELILERVLGWLTTRCAEACQALHNGKPTTATPDADRARAPLLADHDAAVRWYESQCSHLVAAVTHAARRRKTMLAARLCLSLAPLFQARKYWAEWISTHRIGIRCAQAARDQELEAALFHALGDAYLEVGLHDFALDCLEEALRLGGNGGQEAESGAVLGSLGKLHLKRGRLDDAFGTLSQATEACAAAGDQRALVGTLVSLGQVQLQQGHVVNALRTLDDANQLAHEIGDRYGRAEVLLKLAQALLALDRTDRASAALYEALAIGQQLNDRFGECAALSLLSECHRRSGRFPEAYEALKRARGLRVEFDHRYVEGNRWLGTPPLERSGGRSAGRGLVTDVSALLACVSESETDRDWFSADT